MNDTEVVYSELVEYPLPEYIVTYRARRHGQQFVKTNFHDLIFLNMNELVPNIPLGFHQGKTDDEIEEWIKKTKRYNLSICNYFNNLLEDKERLIHYSREHKKRQEEFSERSKIFIEALDIDDVIAHLMVSEGFVTISEIAEASLEELMSIEGFDEDLSLELSQRAKNFVQMESERVDSELKNLKVKVTKLAQGLPVGGEIESLDDGTLFSAFKNRSKLNSNSD